MNLPNNLNCTQFQAQTLERLERQGVDLKSDGARHVLELAQLLDEQANMVYCSLRRVQDAAESRLLWLTDPKEDDALRLGDTMIQFAAEAMRAETTAAEMRLGRKMLQMATQSLIDLTLLQKTAALYAKTRCKSSAF